MSKVTDYPEQFLTHHSVDDETMSADEAMIIFRKHFPLMGGYYAQNQMNYRKFPNLQMAREYQRIAKTVIGTHGLPLEVKVYQKSTGGQVEEVFLSVTYKS